MHQTRFSRRKSAHQANVQVAQRARRRIESYEADRKTALDTLKNAGSSK